MYRLTRLSLVPLTLFAAVLFLAACNAEPEQPELAEDMMEEQVGPIEEELQQEWGWDTWDIDRDARLTRDEFGTGLETGPWWDTWDTDADTYLSEDEFSTAYGTYSWYTPTLYGEWDVNADARLDRDEWETGLFDTWDVNDDAYLTEDEYDESLFEM